MLQVTSLFEKVCALDLEGIVAKRKDSLYRATEKPAPYWIKIKNRNYTQAEGREELFDRSLGIGTISTRRRLAEPSWAISRRIHGYTLAAIGVIYLTCSVYNPFPDLSK